MGRYRGPVEKLSAARKSGLSQGRACPRRKERIRAACLAPPGQHGRGRARLSEHRLQLREKQKAKRFYGLRERQFRTLFGKASRSLDMTGEMLLHLLELRFDNVLYRLGLASTRAQARQFVVHGHIRVNGDKVDVPSHRLKPGDAVTLVPHDGHSPMVCSVRPAETHS